MNFQSKSNASSDTSIANMYISRAEEFSTEAKYDSSIIYLEKARKIYEKEKYWLKYVQCCNDLGNNFWKIDNYEDAMKYLNRALQIGIRELGGKHIAIAKSYNIMGIIYYLKAEYYTALENLNKSFSIKHVNL